MAETEKRKRRTKAEILQEIRKTLTAAQLKTVDQLASDHDWNVLHVAYLQARPDMGLASLKSEADKLGITVHELRTYRDLIGSLGQKMADKWLSGKQKK